MLSFFRSPRVTSNGLQVLPCVSSPISPLAHSSHHPRTPACGSAGPGRSSSHLLFPNPLLRAPPSSPKLPSSPDYGSINSPPHALPPQNFLTRTNCPSLLLHGALARLSCSLRRPRHQVRFHHRVGPSFPVFRGNPPGFFSSPRVVISVARRLLPAGLIISQLIALRFPLHPPTRA